MSLEEKILKLIANREVISLEELKNDIREINKNVLVVIITKLKEKGLVYSSNLLSPTTIVITAKGTNSIET